VELFELVVGTDDESVRDTRRGAADNEPAAGFYSQLPMDELPRPDAIAAVAPDVTRVR
jgi:hypothetical protein